MSPRATLMAFLLTMVAASGVWASFPKVGLVAPLLAIAAMTILMLAKQIDEQAPECELAREQVGEQAGDHAKRTLSNPYWSKSCFAVGAAVSAAVFGFLALTWRQEFPFVGDHDYHLSQSSCGFHFWRKWYLPLGLSVGGAGFILYRWRKYWVALVVLLCLVAAGYLRGHQQLLFTERYPGAFHFLFFPIGMLSHRFHWISPLNALRLTNALSVPCWIFLLRPLLLGRRSARDALVALPFGLFVFFQSDVVYYGTSAYLEPWSLVFVALALENAILGDAARQWKTYLFIGTAAVIKEQAILLLPFFVAATLPLGSAEQGRAGRGMRRLAMVSATVSGVPFVLYYLLRRSAGIWRTVGIAPMNEAATLPRAQEMLHRFYRQFDTGIVAVLLLIVVAGWLVVTRAGGRRLYGFLLAGAAFQVLFFFFDKISMPWTGYPRFHLMPLVVVGAPFFAGATYLLSRRRHWAFVALCASVVACNARPLASLFAARLQGDSRQNFFEHYDAPVYFPISRLAQAMPRGGGSGKPKVRLVRTLGWHFLGSTWGPLSSAILSWPVGSILSALIRHSALQDAGATTVQRRRSRYLWSSLSLGQPPISAWRQSHLQRPVALRCAIAAAS